MQYLERDNAFQKFDQFWAEMQEEWFKAEVLQDYSGEDNGPSLQAWLAGEKDRSMELLTADAPSWVNKALQKADVRRIRVHIVDEPYTSHLEWEMECYRRVNIPLAKEGVYLVPRTKIPDLDLPDGDFSIFDDTRVIKFNYSQNGSAQSGEIYEKGEDISHFLKLKEELLKQADPLEKF